MAFTHTVVEPEFEGRDVGSALTQGALDAVRSEGASVLPFCMFIRSWIQHHPAFADLVPEVRRAQFGLRAPTLPEVGGGTSSRRDTVHQAWTLFLPAPYIACSPRPH
ncbi:GCN5-related N-acetyl-transferase [Blastococcus sp. DSM 46786]|nr:GCN5-related N-acetyl-transferase [Blastococcus sp. DSM 46786]